MQQDPFKKNIIIQYTHNVAAFKEKHLLRLPDGFMTQSIDSETHLLEMARTLIAKSGHLCGKKHDPRLDSPL